MRTSVIFSLNVLCAISKSSEYKNNSEVKVNFARKFFRKFSPENQGLGGGGIKDLEKNLYQALTDFQDLDKRIRIA